MTTPARCTRTDPHPAHSRHKVFAPGDTELVLNCPGVPLLVAGGAADDTPRSATVTRNRSGVEPPADVQATPDPRLNAVERVLADDDVFAKDTAQCVLDALDAMRPDEQTLAQMRANDPNDLRCPTCDHDPTVMCPAPAGLSAAQEIRLRVFEVYKRTSGSALTRDDWAAWVEHGPDETPALRMEQRALRIAAGRDAANARADRAEARLGHIADALEFGGRDFDEFRAAVRAFLVWVPAEDGPSGKDGE